jgi:hypothetical protein
MEKANTKTGYVLLKAFTNSEWDFCDFAIIEITDKWKQELQNKIDAVRLFKDDTTFFNLSFWESPLGFFKDADDMTPANEIIGEMEDWCFVNIGEEEIEKFSKPENRLDSRQLKIDKYCLVWFTARGKHTGEEFYTAAFDTSKLFNLIND